MKQDTTPKLEHLVEEIQDPKIREILRVGSRHGNALRDIYTLAALETLAGRVIALEARPR